MTPFDRALFRQTLATATVATLVTIGVVVSTDEATSTLPMRVARLAALSPLIVAISVLAVTARARSRGEVRALGALGNPPWRAARGAALAGGALAALGVLALLSPWADAASLFPAVHPAIDWTLDATGESARALDVAISANGALRFVTSAKAPGFTALHAWSAAPCLVPIACAVPAWAVTPMSPRSSVVSIAATGTLAIVALHLIASGRVPALFGALSVVPLAAATVHARRRG